MHLLDSSVAPGGYGGGLMDSRGPMDMDTMPDNSRQQVTGMANRVDPDQTAHLGVV